VDLSVSIAGLAFDHFVYRCKQSISVRTREVSLARDSAVILAVGLLEFDPNPDPSGERCGAEVAHPSRLETPVLSIHDHQFPDLKVAVIPVVVVVNGSGNHASRRFGGTGGQSVVKGRAGSVFGGRGSHSAIRCCGSSGLQQAVVGVIFAVSSQPESSQTIQTREYSAIGFALEIADAVNGAVVLAGEVVQHYARPHALRKLGLTDELQVPGFGAIHPNAVANDEVVGVLG